MESADSLAALFALSMFAGAFMLTVSLGIILSFHWFRYGMSMTSAIAALAAYCIVGGILLSLLLTATLAIL